MKNSSLRIVALAVVCLLLIHCKKEQPSVIKLDYTTYYESAAYALAYAEKNYDAALLTNDSAAIKKSKKNLEVAKKTYEETKKLYEKNGAKAEEITAIKSKQMAKVEREKTQANSNSGPTPLDTDASTTKPLLTAAEKRKQRRDSINRVNKENIDKLNAKIKADIEASNAKTKADLEKFGKDVKDLFEGKKK